MLAEPADGGVTRLVDSDGALLLGGHHLGLLLQTADDAVHSVEEVLLGDGFLVVAGGDQGGLVADVGNVSAGESRSLTRQEVDVEAVVGLQRLQMYLEDSLALCHVGQVDVDLTVETSGTQQCLVKHVDAVGGCQNDDTRVGAKAVHLGEQGVERVLALIVATHGGVL